MIHPYDTQSILQASPCKLEFSTDGAFYRRSLGINARRRPKWLVYAGYLSLLCLALGFLFRGQGVAALALSYAGLVVTLFVGLQLWSHWRRDSCVYHPLLRAGIRVRPVQRSRGAVGFHALLAVAFSVLSIVAWQKMPVSELILNSDQFGQGVANPKAWISVNRRDASERQILADEDLNIGERFQIPPFPLEDGLNRSSAFAEAGNSATVRPLSSRLEQGGWHSGLSAHMAIAGTANELP